MKLIEALKITRDPHGQGGKPYPVSVVCGFNPLHFVTFFEAELRLQHPGSRPEIHAGLYGNLFGNLERAAGRGAAAIAILLEPADLDPRLGIRSLGSWAPSALEDITQTIEKNEVLLERMIASIERKSVVAMCLPTLPLSPAAYTPSWRASELELRFRSAVSRLASYCGQLENVRVLSPQCVDRLSPLATRLDVRSEIATGFPYQTGHASMLAEQLCRLLDDAPRKKGLITDLDDTLWKGILGEVGPGGIAWDLDGRAHAYGLYQRFLHALSASGILIAVASKNDPELVREAFQRKDILLPAGRVFPMEVHWGAKSESVRRVLEDWNVGPEAVVLVDDNPAELAEVAAIYPQIASIQFRGEDPDAVYSMLLQLRDLFGKTGIAEEDELRTNSVRINRQLRRLDEDRDGTAGSPESFLRQSEAEVRFSLAKEPLDSRALELINKTNQFNLNGRRYNAAEWREYIFAAGVFLLVVSYRDKYGPLGKVAILTGRQHESSLTVDNWVMSCRAFGRRIEYKCLEFLFSRQEIDELQLIFCATERNKPVKRFLQELLGCEPQGHCSLLKSQFVAGCPETLHIAAEVTHG